MRIVNTLVVLIVGTWLLSCASTKHVPDGEVLYTGVKSISIKKQIQPGEPKRIQWSNRKKMQIMLNSMPYPNGSLFGLPRKGPISVRLDFYNAFYTYRQEGFSRWMMDNLGQPPKLLSDLNLDVSIKETENWLFNQGHFGATGRYEIHPNKKGTKATVSFHYDLPQAYRYRDISFQYDATKKEISNSITRYLENSHLKAGDFFDLSRVEAEKQSLVDHLHDDGYFYIQKSHLLISADTTAGDKQVDIRYQLLPDIPERVNIKSRVIDYSVQIDTAVTNPAPGMTYNAGLMRIRPELLANTITLTSGAPYRATSTQMTVRNLLKTEIFKDPYVIYEPVPDDSSALVAHIHTKTIKPFRLETGGNLALKNTGYFGPSLRVTAGKKNLSGKAEDLSLSLEGYYDFPTGRFSGNIANSFGYSVTGQLSSYIFRSPFKFITRRAVFLPRGDLMLRYEDNVRPDQVSIRSWKVSNALTWRTRNGFKHKAEITHIDLFDLRGDDERIDENQANSGRLIVGTSYEFEIDKSKRPTPFSYFYRLNLMGSGNLLSAVNGLNGPKEDGSPHTFIGAQYSQFTKVRSELRLFYKFGQMGHQLAFRQIVGVAAAYGNSETVPFVEQFYVGGNNSLRPLAARTVGPGRYQNIGGSDASEVGDLLIETNFELRLRMGYMVYGAIWSDLGNVWLLRENPDKPGGKVNPGSLLADSYLTTGIGIRIDLGFLVPRIDWGGAMYAPIFEDGERWVWQNRLALNGFVFAIGLPF